MQQLLSRNRRPDWEQLRPLLDDVLHELSEADHEAVLLRFFRGAAFAERAAVLRINEGAARMRVERALDRRNRLLAKRDSVANRSDGEKLALRRTANGWKSSHPTQRSSI